MGAAEHGPRGKVKGENPLKSWEDICPGQPEVAELEGEDELEPRGDRQGHSLVLSVKTNRKK